MAEDLMNTQTGGTGETIQLQPEVKTTPEQFDVKINPPVDSEPVSTETPAEVATVPTEQEAIIEPTAPVVETPPIEPTPIIPTEPEVPQEPVVPVVGEKGKEVKIETPMMYPSAMSTISSEMEMQRDLLGVTPAYKQNLDILIQPEIDLINLGEPIITSQEPIETEDPIFMSEEAKAAYDKQKEYEGISSNAVKNYLQQVDASASNEEQQQKQAINKLTNKTDEKYSDVLDKTAKFSSEKTYKDIGFDEEEYTPARVSSNYNTFAEYTGLTNEAIDDLSRSVVGKTDDVALMMNNDFQLLDKTNDDISKLENSLKTGKVTSFNPSEYGINWMSTGYDLSKDKTAQSTIKSKIKELESRKQELENKLQQSDYKILKEEVKNPNKTTPSKLVQFENRVNNDLMKIAGTKWEYAGDVDGVAYYKSPVKTIGNEGMGQMPDNVLDYKKTRQIKEDAKWLNREGRGLIESDVKNGTNKFFSTERFSKMDVGLIDYARDIYEIEAKKNYEKTKKIDPYSYDGFKEVARELAMESGTKMNNIIKGESENIIGEFNDLNNEWISKNRPKLNSTIDGVKKSMDQILTNDILSEIEKNPAAQAIRNKYTELLINEEDPQKDNELKAQMYQELKTIPNIQKSFNEYEKTLKNAVTKVQADYSKEYNAFRQEIYSNSVNKMKNAISKGSKEVYREGINNDLNLYQKAELQAYSPSKAGQKGQGINYGANGVVQSPAFKEASFWGKRKMISDQWEQEKANIIYFTKAGIKLFPANDAERSKHWMDWTGQRKMTKDEQSQAWKELPERTGDDARNRYIFYAVDDLLDSPTGKPTVFGIKTYAKEELDRIAFLEKKIGFKAGDHVGDFDKTRNTLPISEEEESQLLQTKTMLNKIMNHPETDQGFWSDLLNGIADGLEVPILGSVLGIQRNLRLGDALKKYQNNTFDSYDLSMVEAQASLNTLRNIKPPSFTYNVGNALGFTGTFMAEMALLGGLNAVGRSVGVKIVDAVSGLAKSSTDDVVRAATANMTAEALTNVQKVVGFITGGVFEGAVNPRAYQDSTKRMIDQISIQESGAYDNLIVQVDKQGEGGFEAFMKGYANYIGMVTIERLGAHLPASGATKKALEYMGTNQFMKRTLVGRMMRDYGFKTVQEASDFLATNKMAWDGLIPEYAEELLQSGWEALITGDKPVFGTDEQGDYRVLGMNAEEAKITGIAVGLFSTGTAMYQNAKARVFSDKVVIEATDTDGNSQIASIQKNVWDKFNSAIGDPKLTWSSALKLINEADLSAEQQSALAIIFAKTRGKEILEDADYIKWKEENKGNVEEVKATREEIKKAFEESEAKLTEEQKAIRDYQPMTTGLQFDQEGKPLNLEESYSALEKFDIDQRNRYFELIRQNEETLKDSDMEVVTQTEDGKEETTNVSSKADELASNAKKRRERKGSKIKTPKAEENVTEDQTGIPSEERIGEEPVQAEPVTETGKETPSPSGVVQEEQKVSQEEIDAYKSSLIKKLESFNEEDRNSEQYGWYVESMEKELKELNEDPDTFFAKRKIDDEIRTVQIQSDKTRTELSDKVKSLMDKREVLSAQEKKSIFSTKKKELKNLDEEIDNTLKEIESLNNKEYEEVFGLRKRQEELDKQKEAKASAVANPVATETKTEGPFQEITSAVPTQEAESMVNEATKIKKMKSSPERAAAETAFQEKHGVSHKKVSNINTNFATIVKSLRDNKLIETDCL